MVGAESSDLFISPRMEAATRVERIGQRCWGGRQPTEFHGIIKQTLECFAQVVRAGRCVRQFQPWLLSEGAVPVR